MALVSLLVIVGAFEAVVALVAPQRMGIPGLERKHGILVPRASIRGRDYSPGDFDVQVSNGPERFRGRSHSRQREPGVARIIVLGDSFTYGIGVSDDEAYPARLATSLRNEGVECEVINAGIYGSGLGQQVIWYDAWVSEFEHDLVVLSVYENDARDDARMRWFEVKAGGLVRRPSARESSGEGAARSFVRSIPGYATLAQHSHLVNFLRRHAGARLRPSLEKGQKGPSSEKGPPQEEAKRGEGAEQAPSFELQGLEIARLKASVAEQGGRLAVVYVPSRNAVRGGPERGAFQEAVAKHCEEQGIPCLDLYPRLRGRRDEGEAMYFDGDFHCTPAGYECIAQGVSDFVAPLLSSAAPRTR